MQAYLCPRVHTLALLMLDDVHDTAVLVTWGQTATVHGAFLCVTACELQMFSSAC